MGDPNLYIILLLLFLVFPIYVLTRLSQLGQEIESLKNQLRDRSVVEDRSATQNEIPERPAVARSSASLSEEKLSGTWVHPRPEADEAPVATPPEPEVSIPELPKLPIHGLHTSETPDIELKPTSSSVPEPSKPPVKRDMESLLGANWLAKLGIAAIAVSVAFFLQYAFHSGWIGPTGQVACGLLLAASMLATGQLLLKWEQYRTYAQALASGGVVVYFLSIYASYSFYRPSVMGFTPAFAALVVGALAASILALKNNTEVVAAICIVGAFATPALIRDGGGGSAGSQINLYIYLGFLNLWIAGLTRLRSWQSLTLISVAGTWLIFFGVGSLASGGWQSEGFASLFLMCSCYFGVRALCSKPADDRNNAARMRDSTMAGVGVILIGCLAFAVASSMILSGPGLFGLPDVSLAGLLLSVVLAALASALPALGTYDSQLRQLFGYLASIAFCVMMFITIESAKAVPPHQVPIAFAFTLFNFLVFLSTSLALSRREGTAGTGAALVGANVIMHITMTYHILNDYMIKGVPALPLWLPIAGLLTLGALSLSLSRKVVDELLCKFLMGAAQVLPISGLLVSMTINAPVRWPTWSLGIIWLEFVIVSISWLSLRNKVSSKEFRADIVSAFLNPAIFFAMMARAVGTERFHGISILAGCAVVMAVFNAFVGAMILKKEDRLQRLIYLGIAVTFLSTAVPLQLKSSFITLAWAVEAAVLVWTGIAVKESKVRVWGMILLGMAMGKALIIDQVIQSEHYHFLLNTRMLAGTSVIVSTYLCAWWLWKSRELIDEWERLLPVGLSLVANFMTLLFVSIDLWDYIGRGSSDAIQSSILQFALTSYWTLYALITLYVGIAYRIKPIRWFAIILLGLTGFKVLALDVLISQQHFHLLLNPRMLAGAFVVAAFYLFAWLLSRHEKNLSSQECQLPIWMIVLANAFTLLFVSVDLWDYAGSVRSVTQGQASAQQLALSLFWTVYAMGAVAVGLWKRLRLLRLFAMGLLYFSIAKVFLFDLQNLETLYRIISFFTLGVILLLVSLLYTRFEARLHSVESTEV